MYFEGTVNINAPRKDVWEFLIDPHTVSQCAPGVSSVEIVVPDSRFRVGVALGLGSVKVKFMMNVEFVELEEPNRAKLKAHGTAPGSATDVVSEMILADTSDGSTELQWSANVNIVGTIASLATRLAPGVTKKLAGEFFHCVKATIEA